MKVNLLALCLASLLGAGAARAADDPAGLFNALERRLQSLNSLEIRYEAATSASRAEAVQGRMIFIKPDRFYHDTPEWTFVETDGEQWRHLKEQNTLIRETVTEQGDFQPERMLFNLRKSFVPARVDVKDSGQRVLRMNSIDKQLAGYAVLEFPPTESVPVALEFTQADGSLMRYQITGWNENAQPDPTLFSPPDVPAENVIDFRRAGQGR